VRRRTWVQTVGRLSSKNVPSLKLPATFSASVSEEKASTMSWNDQASAEKSRNLVSKAKNILKCPKTSSSYA